MPNVIRATVNDLALKKLKAQKEYDGFGNETWGKWLAWKSRDTDISGDNDPGRRTVKYLLGQWCRNLAQNLPEILKGDTISSLVPEHAEEIDSFKYPPYGPAIVVGAGPSIYKNKHLDVLAEAIHSGKYKGIVCASDKMLKPCLEKGITPHIAVSVDGSHLITQWYEDAQKIGDITNVHACLNVTSHPTVLKACQNAGIKVNWFNPLMDQYENIDTFTRLEQLMTATDTRPNGVPAISCGGNAGAATWVLTQSLLRRSLIALIGIDFGYPDGTKLEETPYFSAYMDNAKGDVSIINIAYKPVFHPVFKTTAYIDQIFKSYRQTFLSLLTRMPPWSKTVNCTEGGTLFGPNLQCMKFSEWIDSLQEKT